MKTKIEITPEGTPKKWKIELTPDWILYNLSNTLYRKKDMGFLVVDKDYHFVKLAFDTLGIYYEDMETVGTVESGEYFSTIFIFKLKDIELECPNLYKSINSLNR